MPQPVPNPSPNNDDAPRPAGQDHAPAGRFALVVAAVVLAVLGLGSLAAVLLTELLQGDPWPGFVLLAYACLPLGFLLMIVTVILSIRRRRRT